MRLVVVGNGMAGVRAIEEILARGGGEKFDITVFGDEPYGNYNRILLSNVLAGKDDPREIYLNALDWYTDNGIDLRAGVRVVRLDTYVENLPARRLYERCGFTDLGCHTVRYDGTELDQFHLFEYVLQNRSDSDR